MADKIKSLSQAIRLGATFRPQCRGEYFKYKVGIHDGMSMFELEATCALGAAYEAIAGEPHGTTLPRLLMDRFPELSFLALPVIHWNDRDKLTREQIADRLEEMGH